MPVYTPKKSPLEEALTALTFVGQGMIEGEKEVRRRQESDRDFSMKVAGHVESVRQYEQSFAQGVAEFQSRMDMELDHFDKSYKQADDHFGKEMTFRKEDAEAQRKAAMERAELQSETSIKTSNISAAVQYDRNQRQQEESRENRAAATRRATSYLNSVGLLGPEGTKAHVSSYDVGGSAVNVDDAMLTLTETVRSGTYGSPAAGDATGVAASNDKIDERFRNLGLKPASEYASSEEFLKAANAAIDQYNNGDTQSALGVMSGAGGFTGGTVLDDQGRPVITRVKNAQFWDSATILAAQAYAGGMDAFYEKSPTDQLRLTQKVIDEHANLPALRRALEEQVLDQKREAHFTDVVTTGLGLENNESMRAAAISNSPFYAGNDGSPAFNPNVLKGNQSIALQNNLANMNDLYHSMYQNHKAWLFAKTSTGAPVSEDRKLEYVNAMKQAEESIHRHGDAIDQMLSGTGAPKGVGKSIADWYSENYRNPGQGLTFIPPTHPAAPGEGGMEGIPVTETPAAETPAPEAEAGAPEAEAATPVPGGSRGRKAQQHAEESDARQVEISPYPWARIADAGEKQSAMVLRQRELLDVQRSKRTPEQTEELRKLNRELR